MANRTTNPINPRRQINNQGRYDDTKSPSSAFERTYGDTIADPMTLADDIDNIISAIRRTLNGTGGNWYDQIVSDNGGASAGLNDIVNKRVIRRLGFSSTSITLSSSANSWGPLAILPNKSLAIDGESTADNVDSYICAVTDSTLSNEMVTDDDGNVENLCPLIDADTGEPIENDAGNQILCLLTAVTGQATSSSVTLKFYTADPDGTNTRHTLDVGTYKVSLPYQDSLISAPRSMFVQPGGAAGMEVQDLFSQQIEIRKTAGSALTAGQVVMINSSGNIIAFNSQTEANHNKVLGVVENSVSLGGTARVVVCGLMNITVSGGSIGDPIYSSSTNGTLTVTKPTTYLAEAVGVKSSDTTIIVFPVSQISLGYIWNDEIQIDNNVDIDGELDVSGNIVVGGTVDGIDIATDVAANTTHRGLTNNPHSVDFSDVTPMTTRGDVIYRNATVGTRLAIGTEDYVLTVVDIGGGVLEPRWAAASGGSGGGATVEFIADGSNGTLNSHLSAGTTDGEELLLFIVDTYTYTLADAATGSGWTVQLKGNFECTDSESWLRLVWRDSNSTWYEDSRGFGANVASGSHSLAMGRNSTASGISSASIGGDNTASGDYAVVLGGGEASGAPPGNTASGNRSGIIGGYGHTAVTDDSFIGGGIENDTSGARSAIVGGSNGDAYGPDSVIVGGVSGTTDATDGDRAVVLGGNANNANANNSVAEGDNATTSLTNEHAHGTDFGGSAQYRRLLATVTTTDDDEEGYNLLINGSDYIVIPNNTSWIFTIHVVARDGTANESAGYKFVGMIENTGGVVSLVGSVGKTIVAEEDSTWDCNIYADNSNDALTIKAIGDASNNVNWLATIEITELSE